MLGEPANVGDPDGRRLELPLFLWNCRFGIFRIEIQYRYGCVIKPELGANWTAAIP